MSCIFAVHHYHKSFNTFLLVVNCRLQFDLNGLIFEDFGLFDVPVLN